MSIHRRLRTLAVIGFSAALLVGAPAAAQAAPGTTVHLAGANEFPPNASPATGHFTYQLKGQRLCYNLAVADLSAGVTGAHVHAAPAGSNGGIVIPLTVEMGETAFVTDACVDVDKALIKSIRRTPEQYYVNVHSSAIPSGEIRAQLG